MTEAYLEGGTYVKTFYTVMYCPSFVKAKILNAKINNTIFNSWGKCSLDENIKNRTNVSTERFSMAHNVLGIWAKIP